jgi:hypothetical protein
MRLVFLFDKKKMLKYKIPQREPPMEPPVLLDGRFFASGAYAQPDTHM